MLKAYAIRIQRCRCLGGEPPGAHLTLLIECPACGQQQKPRAVCSNEKCKADIRKVTSLTAGLRFHDLRHHAITELAEGQASEQTIRSIAGHVSQKMLEHYLTSAWMPSVGLSTPYPVAQAGHVTSQSTAQMRVGAKRRAATC
jgi:integrase